MKIYKITNLVNGKVYIGKWQGSRVEDRWKEHVSDALSGMRRLFYSAIRKYGPTAFGLKTIYTAKTPDELSKMETFFILLHQSHKIENGYNMTLGGDGFRGPHTEETKAKLRKVKHSQAFRDKRRKFMLGNQLMLGHHHSEATIAEMKRTRKRTAAQRLAQSEKMKVIRAARPWSTRQLSNA
jgi:group I intron endonuclease